MKNLVLHISIFVSICTRGLEKIWTWYFGRLKLSPRLIFFDTAHSFWFFQTKTSIYWEISTSSALTPYYSLELEEISSTSHSRISRVAIHMICCVSRAKILNYDAPDGRRRTLTSLFLFFDIFVIFQYFSLFFMFLMYLFGFSIEFPARGWSQTVRICKILKNRFFHIYMSFWVPHAPTLFHSVLERVRDPERGTWIKLKLF